MSLKSHQKDADKEYAKYFNNTVSLLQTTASAKVCNQQILRIRDFLNGT